MKSRNRLSWLLPACVWMLLEAPAAPAQVSGGTDVNVSQKTNNDYECAIAKNPLNKLQLFAACNTTGPGLAAFRSTDGGITWTFPDPADRTIADGDAGQGPAACCDPTLAWDTFGNLFIGYIDASLGEVVVIRSADGGATFTNVASFSGSVDQPTVTVSPTAGAVWVVWNQSNQMVARGAPVTGLGVVGAFNALQTIPGTAGCSFGDIAVSPAGVVVQACQSPVGGQGPATIRVNTDTDGLGSGNFGATVAATTTNVGGFDLIPAQSSRSVDSEAGLAYDVNPASPHFGRLYLVYTEETVAENNDTDIMLRFSDNDGANWSAPVRVNDDPAAPIRSQFLPRIASNPLSGNIAVCWHDARNSATNTAMEEYCTIATPTGAAPTFMANAKVGDGPTTSSGANQFGDYSGLAYFQGLAHPIWGDRSNSTGNNPDGTSTLDAAVDRVTGGAAASEGDPHLTTINGTHFDFQAAGDFIALRSADGMEIQTRHTPVETTFTPGPDPYDGLAVKVSVNTGVAARVGNRRVSMQFDQSGGPGAGGLRLRVDGVLTTPGSGGLDLGSGGRIVRSPVGNGVEIEFPNGTYLVVTPGWWTSQRVWYMNVNVLRTPAVEGIMGAIPAGSWLPRLPDGASMGPMPASLDARYAALYQRFGEAWRVGRTASLFDSPDPLVAGCDVRDWPRGRPDCVPTPRRPVPRIDQATARRLCAPVTNPERREDCVFDVTTTGDRGFAETYLLTQRLQQGTTVTLLQTDRDTSVAARPVTFTATVARTASGGRGVPSGAVQFHVDGRRVGEPVPLDASGRATWTTTSLPAGSHRVSAQYVPSPCGPYLASGSPEQSHVVVRVDSR